MTAVATCELVRSRADAVCAHCGLPIPRGYQGDFCCGGCETANAIIRAGGLGDFYAVRARSEASTRGPTPVDERTTGRGFGEFDDPAFARLYCTSVADGRAVGSNQAGFQRVELFLDGVHCSACVWLLERLPRALGGVIDVRVDLGRSMAVIVWDAGKVALSKIAQTLARLGYVPHPARGTAARALRRAEDRRKLVRLGIAGACAGNVMLLAFALYAGVFDSIEPEYVRFFRWLSMILSLVSVSWPGAVFFRGAWAALRARSVNLDVPIAIGLGAGALWGAVSTVRGVGDVYFDSLSVLVLAMLAGRFLQHRQQRRAADSLELLYALTPSAARRVETDGAAERVVDVAIESVRQGDLLEILAGDSIPADGTIESGASAIDESILTGESRPVEVGPGSRVFAGAVNQSGTLRLRVTSAGESTRVGQLMSLLQESIRHKAPIVRLADRIAGWFTIVVLVLAAVTAGAWMTVDPQLALEHSMALLVVSCPCAVGLATPLALSVAIGRAARNGILVRNGEVLEHLARRRRRVRGTILLDKTGTITMGRLDVARFEGDVAAATIAAALESHATHPIAAAIVRWNDGAGLHAADDVVTTIGGGVEGIVHGRRCAVGSPAFILQRAVIEQAMSRALAGMRRDSLTPVLVAVDGAVRGVIGLADTVRPDAASTIARMRTLGWRVGIISGDDPAVVAEVAERVGLDGGSASAVDLAPILGGVTPEQKLAIVRQMATTGPVVMVGDGVNDAAALAAATVGIAVHGGAEASLAAADAYLSRAGLNSIIALLEGSRQTLAVIHRNLGLSLIYNAVAAALAISGVINPLLAAILMPLSSLAVVTSSLRNTGFAPR